MNNLSGRAQNLLTLTLFRLFWPLKPVENIYTYAIVMYTQLHEKVSLYFYPRDAMLPRVFAIATCPSVCPPLAGIVSKRRKLARDFLTSFLMPNFVPIF